MRLSVFFIPLFLLCRCLGAETAVDDSKPGSVVLVHGFMRTSKNMSALAASFKKQGCQVESWSYASKKKYIEEHAHDLVCALDQMAKQRPGQPISFVTHSMGGLIVRSALNQEGCPDEARLGKAVLIAPPNRGSVYARRFSKSLLLRKMLGDKAGHQLMTTPLDGFDALGDFPEGMSVLIISGIGGFNPMIAGVNDGKVGLHETCLNTSHLHETVFAGHSWICHLPKVSKKAQAFLLS